MMIEWKPLNDDSKVVREHNTDGGLDLFAAESKLIFPNTTEVVGSGIAVNIPLNHVGLMRDRSGVFSKGHLINAGTIDVGYENEVGLMLKNVHCITYKIYKDGTLGPNAVDFVYTIKGEKLPLKATDLREELVPEGTYYIRKGDKLCQMVVVPCITEETQVTTFTKVTDNRGMNGFGSTGYGES